MTCLGVLERGERDKANEIGLKEGRGIEMSTTVLPFAMLAPSFEYLPIPPKQPVAIVGADNWPVDFVL